MQSRINKKARNAFRATATTDFLASDVLDRCGRAVPAVPHTLRRTLRAIAVVRLNANLIPLPCLVPYV